ncbi:unnamed protein product, partial [Polarella glacialis]
KSSSVIGLLLLLFFFLLLLLLLVVVFLVVVVVVVVVVVLFIIVLLVLLVVVVILWALIPPPAQKMTDPGPQPKTAQEKQLWDAFQKFDVNGDGKIQADEFNKLMESLGNFTAKEIKRLFSEADSDGSGSVDWREFLAWICSGAATKGMGKQAAASFGRLLRNEQMDEASFVEQANLGAAVTDYLKDQKSKSSDAKKGKKDKKEKSTKVTKKKDDLDVPDDYTGY